jgi:hypothetical protein
MSTQPRTLCSCLLLVIITCGGLKFEHSFSFSLPLESRMIVTSMINQLQAKMYDGWVRNVLRMECFRLAYVLNFDLINHLPLYAGVAA